MRKANVQITVVALMCHTLASIPQPVCREEIVVKGGHVSVVAGPAAVTRIWPSIDQWLGKKSV